MNNMCTRLSVSILLHCSHNYNRGMVDTANLGQFDLSYEEVIGQIIFKCKLKLHQLLCICNTHSWLHVHLPVS